MASFTLLFFWCNSLGLVLAGHRNWEYAGRNNNSATKQRHYSRNTDWIGIPLDPNHGYRLWPNKEIIYCFADEDTEAKLDHMVTNAMDSWHDAGLPQDYKMTKKPPSYKDVDRANTLVIEYNTQGDAATSVGLRWKDGFKPRATVPVDDGVHELAQMSRITHEIGHVWGLQHEHQDPRYWGELLHTGGEDAFRFYCTHLADYDEKTRGLTYPQIYGANGICVNRNAALAIGFSAANYLPILEPMTLSEESGLSPDETVDWDSIMMYSSQADGKDDPATGLNKLVLVRKHGLAELYEPVVPTARDVQAIQRLYALYEGYTGGDPSAELPLLDGRNPRQSEFIKFVCN